MNPIPTLLALLLWAHPLRAGGGPVGYQTVPIPPGLMALQIPLNTYLQTDYISIPVTILPGLRMGRYGVTNREWNACHKAGGCSHPAEIRDDEGPDNPVVRVNWHDAMQFARWLSKMTGRRYRLPTEQEWYYAFSLGRGFKIENRDYAYRGLDEVRLIPKKTWRRGRFGSNAWGVADMVGNVWEWTLSCYSASAARNLAPPDIALLCSPDTCMTRVLGGENCAHAPDFIRDTYQGGCSIAVEPAANIGFRLVLEE